MSDNPLSLENLTMPDFSPERFAEHRARMDAEKREYQAKYGDQWQEKMWDDRDREAEIAHRKGVNERIYYSGRVYYLPGDRFTEEDEKEFDKRLHEVYGDQYDALIHDRERFDPRVAELLIQEAIRTGEWAVLPDALQAEYHKRVGDGV